jgi:hypothetical protein
MKSLGHGSATAAKTIAKCIRKSGVWEAEADMKSLGHGSATAAVDRDAVFTVEGVKL